jgi:transposase-like protein
MTPINNLQELITRFSDEAVCRKYLEDMRWGGNPVCPHCGYGNPYRLKDGRAFRCKSKECKRDFSATVGTVMENSKIPLSKWLIGIYICTNHKKGISSCQLARDLSITQASSWFLIHRIREMIKPKTPQILQETVELDTTWVGGKVRNMSKTKRREITDNGYESKKIPVFGMVQRQGDSIMTVVPDEKNDTLKPIITQLVGKDTVLVSDAATVFNGLENDFKGHIIINHANNEYAVGEYSTNTIEGFFSILKRTIYGTYHNVSPKHLQTYCVEVSHRYNTRKIKDGERFELNMKNTHGRLKYNKLVNK